MLGLTVLAAFLAYLLISIGVVAISVRWARRNGRSAKRWGWGAALSMYLLVFWDHIPTVVLHRYLCATEQGFWVYKTIEQWQQENPGVAQTLRWSESSKLVKERGIARGYVLNQRFAWEIIEVRQPVSFLPVSIHESRIVDRENSEILAKHVTIGSGYASVALGGKSSWKFWLHPPDCNRLNTEFDDYFRRAKRQGERE